MEVLFSEFAFLSDQAFYYHSFDLSTIEDLMKLYEIEAYKAWSGQELQQAKEEEKCESCVKKSEEHHDSAMEEAMAEYHEFEEYMNRLCEEEYHSLINVAESARKLGKNLEKVANYASKKYVEAAVSSAAASMRSALKAHSYNSKKVHPS